MDPFQGQNRINKERVYSKYICSLNLYDGHGNFLLGWGVGEGAERLTLSPAGLGQLAQHFFKAKLLQKLLSVKNSEN
jgi:hypothetical protein